MTRIFLSAVASVACLALATSHSIAAEWKSLLSKDSLDGWKAIDGPIESWQVADGVLSSTGAGGGWISTADEYSDFELELEFRVPPDGNSGVFLRAPHQGNPAFAGVEIQVLDDYAPMYAELKPTQYTGSLYDLVPASPRVTKKAGEWQTMHIRCEGPRIRVEINGQKVADGNLDEHKNRLADHPGVARRVGFVGLQNHGTPIAYRNIRIKPL